ncbi:hypothetical protein CACET_c27580 [Clostridium aceticum]|uniref:Uncharacterized protein n=1 Tax=Clostridium aceticum TaxID=84022 RepID=A0A0D8I8M4_9CLOT|nr:hypothetical protein [Clostridium aceticum]AKL96203.1 hypothetical protein CACET_c27580 [Clostridium aceticum]KJF26618.1 hypothetical protein TZ02_12150 [Clostridium aceticum]
MVKNKARLISILLLVVMIISIIPQTAYASSGFTPVNGISSAGGSGKTPGSPTPGGNSGVWSSRFQGFRITILGYDAAPAFTFMGKDYLDLVFSYDNIDSMDYFGDNHKLGVLRNIYESKNELNTKILSISDINTLLNKGNLITSVPKGADLSNAINNFKSSKIPYPLDLVGGNWISYGNEIKNVFYGSSDKLDINALLYVILNLATVNAENNTVDSLWQPKSDAFLYSDTFTTEELAQLRKGAIKPIELMASKGLGISIEPIIWNKLRISKEQYSYGVYGTQTSIGWIVDWLETPDSNGKVWFNPTAGKGTGGYDTSLFGRMGRRSMVAKGLSFTFYAYRDGAGKVITDYEWTISPPNDTGQSITNKVVSDIQPGWSLHLYRLKAGDESSTQTFDTPEGNNPHPAPDPSSIPLANNEKPEQRNINIIKTYEEDGNHVGTYSRNNNPQRIIIQNEIEYKVDEWFISRDYVNVNESTTWTQIKSNTSSSSSGKSTTTVKVEEPNTTLYVKLIKKTEVVGDADLVIRESQITKAIDTMNPNIPNWGAKTMNFNYQSLSGTCDYIEYCGGCRGNSEDGYWCPGHRCGKSFVLRDTDYDYHFKNIAPIKEKLLANVGVFKALNTTGDDASGNRSSLSAGTDGVSSFNYQMVLWRGKDVPTLASYKENSSHVLNTLLSRYGKQPVGSRTNERVYFERLDTELDMDNSIGDYFTDSKCPEHSSYGLSSTAKNSNKLQYNGDVTIQSYTGVQHKIGNAVTTNSTNIFAALIGKPVSVKFSGGTIVTSSKAVKFYPYIRMTYQLPAKSDNDRINVNVLSQWISELYPHSFAEAAWGSTKDINMNLTSVQWSTHQKAIQGTDGWQGTNKVLPGGSIYNLDTKNQNTYVSVITWQPYIEDEIANKVLTEGGASYKLTDTIAPHDELAKTAEKALDNWRVVQYIEKNTKASNAFNGLKVTGGNVSLNSLGLPNKSSTEDKYYMKPADVGGIASQGDVDIINKTVIEIHYKIVADVEGNITVYRKRDGSGWVEIDRLNKTQGIDALSPESKALNDRTQIITNLITVLTRNEGNDKTASWATSDGKWYNEAFDGINYVRRETCFEIGFVDSPIRSAALDPNLTPVNKGQSDLFSTAFISQFRMNDKSDAYSSEVSGYVGKFKGQNVILNGAENMFKTRVFSIPNVNVQDIKGN